MQKPKILFVDSDENILKSYRRIFRKEQYSLFFKNSVAEALIFLEAVKVDLIISANMMTEMTGLEFFKIVKEKYPQIIRVLITGYTNVDTILSAVNEGSVYQLLTKPWNDEVLKLAVKRSLEQSQVLKENQKMSEKITQQNLELKDLNMKLEVIVRERTRVLQITQQIVERLPVAVLGLGEDGMITLANQKARQLISGYNENIIGQDIWELLSEDTIIKFNKIGDMEGKPVKMNLSEKILLLEIIRVSESGGFLGFVYVDSIVNDWNNETSPYPLLVSENE